MEEIKRLRAEIDVIDEEILKLLNKRAKLAKSIGEIKTAQLGDPFTRKGEGGYR